MKEKTIIECIYCKSEINFKAKVCPICNKHQKWYVEYIAHGISVFLIGLSVVQLLLAFNERSKAEYAYEEAITAKNEIVKAKEDIKSTEIKLAEVGDAVVVIADILPRSTGYGAGMSTDDRILLKQSIVIIKEYRESLNVKLK